MSKRITCSSFADAGLPSSCIFCCGFLHNLSGLMGTCSCNAVQSLQLLHTGDLLTGLDSPLILVKLILRLRHRTRIQEICILFPVVPLTSSVSLNSYFSQVLINLKLIWHFKNFKLYSVLVYPKICVYLCTISSHSGVRKGVQSYISVN